MEQSAKWSIGGDGHNDCKSPVILQSVPGDHDYFQTSEALTPG